VADPKTYTEDEYNAMIAERDALKANRDEILKEAKRSKDALKNYEGVDPERFRQLVAAAEEAERQKATAEGDFKVLEKQLIERHTKELDGRDGKIGKLTKALEKRLREDELRKALNGKVDPDMTELIVEHGSKFVKVRETDDDFEHYITDERGNQQFSDGMATPMTMESFVDQTLKTKFPKAFLGTGSSGGGATKSHAGGGAPGVLPAGDNMGMSILQNLDKVRKGEIAVPVT